MMKYVIMAVGLILAQWLMDVPTSGGDITVFAKHTAGIWLAFFTGALWAKLLGSNNDY